MRIVVKVGTSTLAHATGRLNIRHTEELVKVLSDLKNAGHDCHILLFYLFSPMFVNFFAYFRKTLYNTMEESRFYGTKGACPNG